MPEFINYTAKKRLSDNLLSVNRRQSNRVLQDNRLHSFVLQKSDNDTSDMEEALSSDSEEASEVENNIYIDGVLVYIDPPMDKTKIKQARKIIATIRGEYAIEFNSAVSLHGISDAIDDNEAEFSEKEIASFRDNLKGIEEDSWTIDQLEAVKIGLSRFASLLGRRRLKRSDGKQNIPQEITTFGKVDQDMQGGFTLAETFRSQNNIALYEEGRDEEGEYPSREEMIQTVIHELTHGLIAHRTDDFKDAIDFWSWSESEAQKEDTISGYSRTDFEGEEPPTSVAYGNPEEDFAESVSMYLYSAKSKKDLKREFPIRYAIVESILNEELSSGIDKSRRIKNRKAKKRQSNRREINEHVF